MQRRVWIALFALIVQAVLPSVIHAAASRNAGLAEICTAFGIKKVALKDADAPDSGIQRQHCPVCSVADAFALPVSLGLLPLPAHVSFASPQAVASQCGAATPLSLHLRGPPAFS